MHDLNMEQSGIESGSFEPSALAPSPMAEAPLKRSRPVQLLDAHTVNQIAAGEVVERPASVVKELVENALDAGATQVRVRVVNAGRTLIEVDDNGCGMSEADALTALQRHATSKIRRVEDLLGAISLGFRGEAIPSIASVSRFYLSTAEEDGSRVVLIVEGGTPEPVRHEPGRRGTTVRVEDLFFNTPARLKFQKTAATEMGLIVEWMGKYAMAYPHVAFRLVHGNHVVLESTGDGEIDMAIAAVWGKETARALVPFSMMREGVRVRGFVSPPHLTKPTRSLQWIFVNGRPIRNRALYSALDAAFRQLTPERRYPICALMIDLDPSRVDMNVSPTKSEARFQNERQVFDAVRTGVRDSLLAHGMYPSADALARANAAVGDAYGQAKGSGFAGAYQGHFPSDPGAGMLAEYAGFGASSVPQDPPGAGRWVAAEFRGMPGVMPDGSESSMVPGEPGYSPPYGSQAGVPQGRLGPEGPLKGFGASPSMQAARLADPDAAPSGANVEGLPGSASDRPIDASKGAGATATGSGWAGFVGYAGPRHIDPESPALHSVEGPMMVHPTPQGLDGPAGTVSGIPEGGGAGPHAARYAVPKALPNAAARLLEGLRILGQTSDAFFILAENRDGILVIDQHVAHERILFEKLRASRGLAPLERQPLLTPLSLELDRQSMAVAMEHLPALDEAGFEVEPFGASTLLVRSTPAAIRREDPLMVLRDLIDDLGQGTHGSRLSPRENVWVMCSCKMAIKAGERLSPVEMEKLILDLAVTENPFLCPHGRPITIVLSHQDLLRKFKRA